MGRSSGFIAAHATLSSSDVDLCLIPEVPIELEGENGCLPHLMRRVKDQGYAVVVVAEVSSIRILLRKRKRVWLYLFLFYSIMKLTWINLYDCAGCG